MGLSNFTTGNDDDDQNGNGGSGFPGFPGMPPLGPLASGTADPSDILIDYNERYKSATPALFRERVIEQTLAVLIRKDKPNALMVGPAGVGKTRIVEEIARMIAVGHDAVPVALRDKTIYELPMAALVAGAGVVGQLEERVAGLVDFASDPKNKAILFIDEIHVLADRRDPVYSKVAQILKPALARGDMHVIGATTTQESRNLEDDPAFERRFTRLIVDELTREQTVQVLLNARSSFLAHHRFKVTVSDEMIALVATVADEFSRASQHRPDNAVTLLDQALADVIVSHGSAVAQAIKDGNQALAQALQSIPTLTLTENKLRSVALKLASGVAVKGQFDEAALTCSLRALRGQEDIVDELVDVLRRDELGAFARTKPLAWMLAGPSGSGKTETAKIISEYLTDQKPIVLNMGEYPFEHDLSKLIGAGPGYVGSDSNKELPFDTLEANPYRVILLDELEKAHRTIHRLLLTALDEGWLRMADGKVIDFSKATIIATTNAGRDTIGKPETGFAVTAGVSKITPQRLASALKEHFEPEVLGRFQKVVAYAPITRELYSEILTDVYNAERERLLQEKPRLGALVPALDPAVLAQATEETFLPEQGARPAQRAARRLIEDALLQAQAQSQAGNTTQATVVAVTSGDSQASESSTEDQEGTTEISQS